MGDQVEHHRKEFGEDPVLSLSVPQPTVLAGQFSDLIEAKSLICLTDDGLSLSFSPRSDNVVRIVNSVRQDKKKFSYSNIKYRREDRWANAVKAVMYELGKAGIKIGGYNILVRGRGAGADSWSLTSSLFVGILVAMNELEGLSLSKERMLELSLAANSFCSNYQARRRDLWILLNAEEGKVYLWSEKKGTGESLPFSVSGAKIYILSSSLPFQVLTPEEDEFRTKAKDVISHMAERNISLGDIRKMSEKEARSIASRLPDVERRCLTHLVLDNECAVKAAEAIVRRDCLALGRSFFALQRSVVENAELTSPEMDWIWRRGQEGEGVIGLCSIGLGIAGSFIAIVDDRASNLYARREEEYERIFGFRSSVRPFYPLKSPEAVRY